LDKIPEYLSVDKTPKINSGSVKTFFDE